MQKVSLFIDGKTIEVSEGTSLLEAAHLAGSYIPTLCAHPDLPPGGACGLCLVEAGSEVVRACETPAAQDLQVQTDTEEIRRLRRDNLSHLLKDHPHACLTCAQKVGCSRTQCSSNVAVNERCCAKLGNCEIERVVEHVGLREDLGRYVYPGLPKFTEEPLFTRDYNLCIGCQRCVRACRDLRGVDVLEAYEWNGRTLVRAKAESLVDSGCRFCTACVEVCPTGALLDKDVKSGERETNLVPCRGTCPAGIDVPRYVDYVARGEYGKALAVVREKVPFPGVLGRVCFHPCEDACRRGQVSEAVAICRLKRFAADHGGVAWKERRKPARPTGKKVAVVGSGPAGLTAAHYLALKGHSVTVFEARSQAGGMLRFGIPAYRLPEHILREEIAEIEALGVGVITQSRIEKADALLEEGYAAVFVAVGAQKGVALAIPGEDRAGVVQGIDFLRGVALRENAAVGSRVAVIGGGNVALDAARTALRLGAQNVTVLYRRSREEMPAYAGEVGEAAHEGVQFEFLSAPVRIQQGGTSNGRTLNVICQRQALGARDGSGRRRPQPLPGSEFAREFDQVIVAIGQEVDLPEHFGPVLDGKGIRVDPETLMTGRVGVFAGGDAVLGPASVIEAVAQGRRAARAMDKFLGGDGDISEVLLDYEERNPWLGPEEGFALAGRVGEAKRPWQKSKQQVACGAESSACPTGELFYTAFTEVDIGLLEEMAEEEAGRCLKCQLRLRLREAPRPPEKWLVFDAKTVEQVPETEGVYQLLDADKEIISIVGTANLREALKEQLGRENACCFGYEEDRMYTQRESQLMQQFLQEHGRLPQGADDLDDLF
ncbi:Adrenodoxin reductase family signature [Acididesulfobacillus acetoxydans]|uniref:Adrenodoxin reductase family signature n=1 Tax=Acididesulfobacillus acetoxydans TaxID=1561005 RepID=A0A8S0Y2R9_9FIRM|nr:FAD-dependent oxidoreductase [Acididesulfobacillus acetoxydans]CAA7601105.1 Adrenodoxin reductase family signature [Acididesulfobacillus acetoxydans]CEJ06979.1 Sulfide dehydrogenase subunit alpha [Acididesulfobacillus acetoxydans]